MQEVFNFYFPDIGGVCLLFGFLIVVGLMKGVMANSFAKAIFITDLFRI